MTNPMREALERIRELLGSVPNELLTWTAVNEAEAVARAALASPAVASEGLRAALERLVEAYDNAFHEHEVQDGEKGAALRQRRRQRPLSRPRG